MKKPYAIALLAAAVLCAAALVALRGIRPALGQPRPMARPDTSPSVAATTNRARNPASRAKDAESPTSGGSDAERLRFLEQLGQVPEGADMRDWQLAQRTTWWGKRLDPARFWRGRVIWLDESAEAAARRHGRRFPPIPFDDPTMPTYGAGDADVASSWGEEGPPISYRMTTKERAFWERFIERSPWPPTTLEREHFLIAESSLESGGPGGSIQKRRARESGFPAEGLTDDALFWVYVQESRSKYENLLQAGWGPESAHLRNFFARLAVEPRYITEPLGSQDKASAGAWKIAYLQRLRKENTEESYINAYLQAWNLSATDVFSPTNK